MGAGCLRTGADLAHVFCIEEASIPIKSYSPELMVHPILNDSQATIKWFDSCTSIVIGPGLSRDSKLQNNYVEIIEAVAKNEKMPLVADADILWFMAKSEVKDKL